MDNASELVAARIELQNVDEILGLRGGYGPFHDNLAAFNIRRADLIAHIEFLEGKVEDSSGDGDEPETRENDIADPEVDHDSDVGDDENGATNGALVATLGTNINSRGINDDSDGDSDDLYWRRLFDRVEQQNLPASPQAPRRQCTACAADGEDRDGNDILTTVPCNHACCRTWITRMFTDSIANGSVRCPPQCCNTCFDPTMARDLSTVYFYRKFVRKCSELATPFNERLYCAWPGCHEFIMRRLRVESQPDVGCPSSRCALSTCTRCERIAHLGVCQLSAPDPELAVMRREARNLGYKNCQCGMAIVRTDGCNHMTCTQCGYEFCYGCEAEWDTCDCGDVEDEDEEEEGPTELDIETYIQPRTTPHRVETLRVPAPMNWGRRADVTNTERAHNRRRLHRWLRGCDHEELWFKLKLRETCDGCSAQAALLHRCRGCALQICGYCRRNLATFGPDGETIRPNPRNRR